jgi:hypothetical protein|tara:strand:+ start:44237 stop:44395 length:159 start_codon:yes stop_codon:yes gene_type:complete
MGSIEQPRFDAVKALAKHGVSIDEAVEDVGGVVSSRHLLNQVAKICPTTLRD